jgi:hypothetical protein
MRISSTHVGLVLSAICGIAVPANAAPASEASCIYDMVAPDKLGEFGKSAIGEEAEAGLDPILNAARNACIDQHGWSDVNAKHAEEYFFNRVAQERLGVILRREGVDTRKLDRAYEALVGGLTTNPRDDGAYHQALIAAMQKQGFYTDDSQLLKAALGYSVLRKQQEQAQAAFAQGLAPAP